MSKIDFMAGEHISKAAEMLVAAATEHGKAQGVFNDITLKASPSSTVAEIVADYDQQSGARSVAWRNSPEGKAAATKREAEVQARQEQHDALVCDLASLDFTNDVAVLDWLCAIQEPTDDVSVLVNKPVILTEFSVAGFKPGANCGDDFDAENRENVFRYIVGQALDGMERIAAIHGIVHKFVADWKVKFVGAVQ